MKKRFDIATLRLMNLDKSHEVERLYEFDDPITSVKIFDVEHGGQGIPPFYAIFFSDDKVLKNMAVKGNAASLYLTTCEEDDDGLICADPRIVATCILGAWLDYPFCLVDEYDKEKELTEALNPVFTREEALGWLEQCGFIGFNNYHNPFRVEDRTKWYISNPEQPGFDIYFEEPNIQKQDVPLKARKLYDKYIDAYLKFVEQRDHEINNNLWEE